LGGAEKLTLGRMAALFCKVIFPSHKCSGSDPARLGDLTLYDIPRTC
jgi:hypothetical protein